jgi:hypothetical protein
MNSGTPFFRMSGSRTLPDADGTYNLTAGTIELYGSGTAQGLKGTNTYYNVIISNTSSVTNGVTHGSGNIGVNGEFRIKNGSTYKIGDDALVGSGSFFMETNATLIYGSANGITSSGTTGNIRLTGTRTFPTDANYGFRGSSNMVTGNGLPSTVANLYLQKGAINRTVTLSHHVTATGTLDFSGQGTIILSDKNLTVANAVNAGTTNGWVVTLDQKEEAGAGFFGVTIPADGAEYIFPIGISTDYTPCYLTGALSGHTAKVFTARVFSGVYSGGTSGTAVTSKVINRSWQIEPASASNNNVTVKLQWNSSTEAGDFNTSLTHISKHSGTAWAGTQTNALVSGNPRTRSVSGITSFSTWTVASDDQLLPVQIVSFSATKQEETVIVKWVTASEQQNKSFEVQESKDGVNFYTVATIAGRGTYNGLSTYQHVVQIPQGSYYRLKQTDENGTVNFGKVIFVSEKENLFAVRVSPNPIADNSIIDFGQLASQTHVTLTLYDISGVKLKTVETVVGEASEYFNQYFTNLSFGLYLLQIETPLQSTTVKLLKQ